MTEAKKALAIFLLFFPSILIAGVPSQVDGGILWPIVFKGLLVFYQYIALKNFVDRFYGE